MMDGKSFLNILTNYENRGVYMKVDLTKYNQSWYSRGKSSWYILLWWFIQGTIFRFSIHNMYKFRNFLLKLFGAKIGKNVKIRSTAKITYPWKVEIGDNTWIGDDVVLYSLDNIKIGSNCVISQRSYICTGSHDIESESFNLIVKPITIEDYSWIAADVFVGQGVTIREGSVIAARSSIYKDSEPWMVYVGNPAKPVKKRKITRP